MRTLSDAVSLDDWRLIVQAAVAAAKKNDPMAREWLTRYLIGKNPKSLAELAATEQDCDPAEVDIEFARMTIPVLSVMDALK